MRLSAIFIPIAAFVIAGLSLIGIPGTAGFISKWYLVVAILEADLVWAVLRDYLWSYPWMIAFLLVFIVFQGYQIVVAFSWAMVLLTLFDIFIVWLTWHEYGVHRARIAGPQAERKR